MPEDKDDRFFLVVCSATALFIVNQDAQMLELFRVYSAGRWEQAADGIIWGNIGLYRHNGKEKGSTQYVTIYNTSNHNDTDLKKCRWEVALALPVS